MSRTILILLGLLSAALLTGRTAAQTPQDAPPAVAPDQPAPFSQWLEGLLTEARQRGFSETLLQQTLVGIEPLVRVIESDRSQPELAPGFSQYLSTRLTTRKVARGKDLIRTNRALLTRIQRTYGIQARFLVAIWGLESNYGGNLGRVPAFQALATLAWEPRRAQFFRGELFQALMIVDRGYIEAPVMTGSWAGALGQPQFMPSSYMQYAVDFDGDHRRDIWRSTPDTLASIANYLKGFEWNGQETWGREVQLSASVQQQVTEQIPKRTEGCYARRNMTERRPLREWRKLGVRLRDGGMLPTADIQAGLVDVGERKFLVYPNYDAILSYNCAHYYALSVALLGDSLR